MESAKTKDENRPVQGVVKPALNPVWTETFDDDDNSIWEATSPYHYDGSPFYWRLKQRLCNNNIEWYEAHDLELMSTDGEIRTWETGIEAMDAISQDHRDIICSEAIINDAV
jgi:hypothetical protein